MDNKGNRLLVHEESSINVPAIAAAHVIKRYIGQASDELSFEVTTATVHTRKDPLKFFAGISSSSVSCYINNL